MCKCELLLICFVVGGLEDEYTNNGITNHDLCMGDDLLLFFGRVYDSVNIDNGPINIFSRM